MALISSPVEEGTAADDNACRRHTDGNPQHQVGLAKDEESPVSTVAVRILGAATSACSVAIMARPMWLARARRGYFS